MLDILLAYLITVLCTLLSLAIIRVGIIVLDRFARIWIELVYNQMQGK